MINSFNFIYENTNYNIGNFQFSVANHETNKNIIQVTCAYKCNEVDITLLIYYPNSFANNIEQYKLAAENLIKKLIANKEFIKYTLFKVKNKEYLIDIDKNANFEGFVDINMLTDEFLQSFSQPKSATSLNVNTNLNSPLNQGKTSKKDKKNNNPVNKNKKLKVWSGIFTGASLLSLALIGFGVYEYWFKGVSSLITITFNLGNGYIQEKQQAYSFKTAQYPKGVKWSEILENDSTPKSTAIICEDGYEFNKWTDEGVTLSDSNSFSGNTTITASYKIKESSGNFEKDGFITIDNITKEGYYDKESKTYIKGFEGLKKAYGVNSFIGKTKTITMFDKEYTVRVIGENGHNLWYIAEYQLKHTALTFEFTNVFDMKTLYSTTESNKYNEDINISKFLNETLINYLPSDLQKTIRKTKVEILNKDETQQNHTTIRESLFLPSATELGFTEFPDSGGSITKLDNEKKYAYYDTSSASLKKTTLGSEVAVPYYIRTPNTTNDKALMVNAEGNLINVEINENGYFSPCFSIGYATT